MKACTYTNNFQQFSKQYVFGGLDENTTSRIVANIPIKSELEKTLIDEKRLIQVNGNKIVLTPSGTPSQLFNTLKIVSQNPELDYDYVHSNEFIARYGNWTKAQNEWLSGNKSYKEAIRSNKLNPEFFDENLEPKSTLLYSSIPHSTNNPIPQLFKRLSIDLEIKIDDNVDIPQLIFDNIDMFPDYGIKSIDERIDVIMFDESNKAIIDSLIEKESSIRGYYENGKVVIKLSETDIDNLAKQFNYEKICL
jgi:hypothetical protein